MMCNRQYLVALTAAAVVVWAAWGWAPGGWATAADNGGSPESVFDSGGPPAPSGAGAAGFGAAQGEQVAVRAGFTPPDANRTAELFITATIQPGWHIYSITQAPGGPLATKINLDASDAYRLLGDFRPDPAPKKKVEAVFNNLLVETHTGTVTWFAAIRLAAGADPERVKISGRLNVQACQADQCLPPRDVAFVAGLTRGAVPAAPSAAPPEQPAAVPGPPGHAAAEHHIAWQPFTSITALADLVGPGLDLEKVRANVHQEAAGAASLGLWGGMVLGFLGGLLLNIMPCVLPVIGLKILSFIEQAGHDRRRAFALNAWYSLGLMSVFFVLATLAVSPQHLGWGQLFSKTWFSITLAAVVFTMGLSFLGVWEMPIPGFAGRGKASELAAREGAVGAFAKGALTTVLATPCSAPFLAPALFWAVAQPPLLTYAVLLATGFGMASPYLVLGAFPEALRFLPKPGAWMDTFKQVMGFVLMGTVVFMLTFLRPPDVVPTIGLLFGLWVACWWIGRLSPLAEAGAKVRTWLGATALAAVVWVLMFPGITAVYQGPFSFAGLAEVMAQRQAAAASGILADTPGPPLVGAASGPRTVLVDFTADWCLTCKTLEAAVLDTPAVAGAIRANRVVALRADWTHEPPEISKMLEVLGGKQVPVLAVFSPKDPNHPAVFRGGYTQRMLLDALEKTRPSGL
ncbi:MAG: cytochrome c biogenesis protein CcdA [Thermoguttaceae bacterium]|jgi:thiol:disulfide interchange protein DsbD